jgi:sec-independent protein translocase protein TatA
MGIPNGGEWLIILIVVFLLFGAKKIPDLAKGIGEGLKEFKKATRDDPEKSLKEEKNKEIKSEAESKPESK